MAIMPISTGFRVSAQIPSEGPVFAVATVKPVLVDASHPFNPRHYGVHVNLAGASYWSMRIRSLVAYAYRVDDVQVAGPEWTNSDHFDIEARFPEGVDGKEDRRMLQALLKERFKLDFKIEKKELEVYALIVDKNGMKMRPSPPDPVDAETKNSEAPASAGDRGSSVTFNRAIMAQHIEDNRMTIETMARALVGCAGPGVHMVVDETGLTGSYQVAFDCPMPRVQRSAGATDMLPSDEDDGSSLTRSLDALGLKLQRRKVPMDVYVIHHVERPSEN